MNYFDLSDKELIMLHKKNKINAITFLYYKYRRYSYAFIYKILSRTPYLNVLFEEKDAIIIDSIKKTIEVFDDEKGEFKSIYINIVNKETIKRIQSYQKNPLSDSISLSKRIPNSDNLTLMDVISDESLTSPNDHAFNEQIKKEIYECLANLRSGKMKEIIELKLDGYSYKEIAEKMNCTIASIYASLYRFQKLLKDNKDK